MSFGLEDLKAVKNERIYEEYQVPHPDISKSENITVRFRSLFSDEYHKLMGSLTNKKGKPIQWRMDNANSLLVAHTWVDNDDKRVLYDDRMILDPFWQKVSPGFLQAMIEKAREICRVSVLEEEDEDDDDLGKNSEPSKPTEDIAAV